MGTYNTSSLDVKDTKKRRLTNIFLKFYHFNVVTFSKHPSKQISILVK